MYLVSKDFVYFSQIDFHFVVPFFICIEAESCHWKRWQMSEEIDMFGIP